MYKLMRNGANIANVDELIPVKENRNGVFIPCELVNADGVVACDGVEPTNGLEIRWFNGPAKLEAVTAQGAALAQASTKEPPATVGVLADGFPVWEPGMVFDKQYSLFEHKGDVYFTRQPNITAYAHQEPGTTGMESVYGIRPIPDDEGVYPYRYNMAASVGMLVRDSEGDVWRCTHAIDPMLYPPEHLPAHFILEE